VGHPGVGQQGEQSVEVGGSVSAAHELLGAFENRPESEELLG
jgi:hypothetical protein